MKIIRELSKNHRIIRELSEKYQRIIRELSEKSLMSILLLENPCPSVRLLVCHVFYKHLTHTLTNLISECVRQIFRKCSDFRKIFRFSKNFQIFGKFSDFLKIFRFLEFFRLSKIFRFSENFQIFKKN